MLNKKYSLAGKIAMGSSFFGLVLVVTAFFSNSWLVSDRRVNGAELKGFGLWNHCFNSLPDPYDKSRVRIFVGCHWLYDQFTDGYAEFRSFLLPRNKEHTFILATQFFYTIAFLGTLTSVIGSLILQFCYQTNAKRFIKITSILGGILITSSISAAVAMLIFVSYANRPDWMPGHDYNYYGWSCNVAIASFFVLFSSGSIYLVETNILIMERKFSKLAKAKFNRETRL